MCAKREKTFLSTCVILLWLNSYFNVSNFLKVYLFTMQSISTSSGKLTILPTEKNSDLIYYISNH